MKRCIITGGNSGIGRSAAFQIAGKGYSVVLACRNMEQAQKACEEIIASTGNPDVIPMKVDLSLMVEVKRFVSEYTERFQSLDVLINNAADFDLSRKAPSITSEGSEAQFATNLLAPFALVEGLLPLLLQSDDGRIINISSQGLTLYPKLVFDFDAVKGQKNYSPAKTYYQTKLGLLMLSLQLRERLAGSKVSVYCIRVTNVKVDITRYANISPVLKWMYGLKSKFSISPDDMARVYTELATGEKRQGFYFDEKLREVRANQSVYDSEAQRKLWNLGESLLGKG